MAAFLPARDLTNLPQSVSLVWRKTIRREMRGSTRIVHDASKVVHLAQRLHRHYVSSYHGGQRRLHIETVVMKEIFVEDIQFEVVS